MSKLLSTKEKPLKIKYNLIIKTFKYNKLSKGISIVYYSMTRKAINYSKCVIYKIVCNDLNVTDLYVGSTTDFTKRKSQHKSNSKNSDSLFNIKVYNMIRDNGGWDNWVMLEIEKYPCNDNNEARFRERYWLEILNAKLNMINPIRTKEESIENNKKRSKEYRDREKTKYKSIEKPKKETIDEYYKRFYEENKEILIEYSIKKIKEKVI